MIETTEIILRQNNLTKRQEDLPMINSILSTDNQTKNPTFIINKIQLKIITNHKEKMKTNAHIILIPKDGLAQTKIEITKQEVIISTLTEIFLITKKQIILTNITTTKRKNTKNSIERYRKPEH